MFRKIVITLATVAAACTVAPLALAGTPSATLDGAYLTAAAGSTDARCSGSPFSASASFQASGSAAGAYAGTFVAGGTAALGVATTDGRGLVGLDASFTITSTAGTIKGTLRRVSGRTVGSGECDIAKEDVTIAASGVVYTVTLPDGTVDQGVVDLSFSDVPATAGLTASFRSTSRIADADLDGVVDGVDNCSVDPNADQSDVDADGLGDACDIVDDRPALFDDLVESSKAAAIPKALVTRAERARTAYFRGDVGGACSELTAYVDGVAAKRGRTIAPAVADALVGKAQHIRKVVSCA